MSNMNVTYAEMTSASAQLKRGKEDITMRLSELSAVINNLVASGFVTDKASGAYQERFQQFTQGVTQAIEGLEGLASYLDGAAMQLESTDESLANSIRG